MKKEDIKKLIPLKKKDLFLPLEGLSKEDLESLHYCDLADSQLL